VTEKTQAMTPDEAAAAAAAAAERPAHRRSIFFDHEERIRSLLADGRSYRQILCMLKLKHMSRSVLARWCARQGLRSTATSAGPSTAKKSASTASPVAPTVPPAPTPRPPLADAYGPEPSDPLADLRPTTPRSNP